VREMESTTRMCCSITTSRLQSRWINETAKGHHLRVVHTPDFFVNRGLRLAGRSARQNSNCTACQKTSPKSYCWDQGSWRCPPGEAYACRFGMYYRVRSWAEINWVRQRNLQFIEDYLGAALQGQSENPIVGTGAGFT
jgi:putative transposase